MPDVTCEPASRTRPTRCSRRVAPGTPSRPSAPRRWRRWARRPVLALTAAALVLAACSSSNDGQDVAPHAASTTTAEPPTTTVTTSPRTTTTTRPDPKAEVEAAYLEGYRQIALAATDPSIDTGRLSHWLSGASLRHVIASIVTMRRAGTRVQFSGHGMPRPVLERTSIHGDTAMVTACLVDDSIQVDRDNAVMNDQVVAKRLRATLLRTHSVWRTDSQRELARWTNRIECGS